MDEAWVEKWFIFFFLLQLIILNLLLNLLLNFTSKNTHLKIWQKYIDYEIKCFKLEKRKNISDIKLTIYL